MTGPADRAERLRLIASALSIGGVQRHIFLCAQQSNPRCSTYEESKAAWRRLRSLTKRLGLASAPPPWRGDFSRPPVLSGPGRGTVLRSKVDCLRVCEQGPIAVVYPDGVWYRSAAGNVLDRIVQEHLVEGRPVEEYVFAVDDLAAGDLPAPTPNR